MELGFDIAGASVTGALSAESLGLALSLLVGGFVAGVLAGFFGVGGGIIIVPMLYHVFGFVGVDESIRMHQAVATSLATIIVTSIRSLTRHATHGAVDGAILRRWTLPVIVGVGLGALVADFADGIILSAVFIVLALIMGAYMGFGREDWRLADDLPVEPWRALQGTTIGFLSSLAGIGGGVLGISLMSLHGVAIHRAIGTASGLGLMIGVPGAIGLAVVGWGEPGRAAFSLGFVNLLAFGLIVPMTMLSVPIGVRLAHSLSKATLRRAFAGFLVVIAFSMLFDLIFAR